MDTPKRPIWVLLGITLLLYFYSLSVLGEGFPLREKYPEVPIIEINDLFQQYENVVIVDVRSRLEFSTVHISKALHVALSNILYVDLIKNIRRSNPQRKLVLYCNGHSCAKSYKATKKAIGAAIDNVFAFDAGIFDWATTYPGKTTLLGESPADINKIISKAEFNSVLKDYSFLLLLSQKDDVMVIDIRDRFQMGFTPPFKNVKRIKLDSLLAKFMIGELKDKKLIFIDAVGKQIRWLQYYLKEFGYTDYMFLRGGVASVSS